MRLSVTLILVGILSAFLLFWSLGTAIAWEPAWYMVYVTVTVECSNGQKTIEVRGPIMARSGQLEQLQQKLEAFDQDCREDMAPLVPVLLAEADHAHKFDTVAHAELDAGMAQAEVRRRSGSLFDCITPTLITAGEWSVVSDRLASYCVPYTAFSTEPMPPSFLIAGFLLTTVTSPPLWGYLLLFGVAFGGTVPCIAILLSFRHRIPSWLIAVEAGILVALLVSLFLTPLYFEARVLAILLLAFLIDLPRLSPTQWLLIDLLLWVPLAFYFTTTPMGWYQLVGWLAFAYLLVRWRLYLRAVPTSS